MMTPLSAMPAATSAICERRRRHVLLPDRRLHEPGRVADEVLRRREVRGRRLARRQVDRRDAVEAEGRRLGVELLGAELLADEGVGGVARSEEDLGEVVPPQYSPAKLCERLAGRVGEDDGAHRREVLCWRVSGAWSKMAEVSTTLKVEPGALAWAVA